MPGDTKHGVRSVKVGSYHAHVFLKDSNLQNFPV